MIPEQFPTLDPLTSFGLHEGILHDDHYHKMLMTLTATSRRLRWLFRERSWKARVLAGTKIPAFSAFLKQPETSQIFIPQVGCVKLFLSPVPLTSIRVW